MHLLNGHNGHDVDDRSPAPLAIVEPVPVLVPALPPMLAPLMVAVVMLLLACVAALVLCTATLWGINNGMSAERQRLERREADGAAHAGQMEALRKLSLAQHTAILAQDEQLRRISAENLRLAESINQRLKGGD